MSNNLSILSEEHGEPVCWNWDTSRIIQYIQNNQEQAYYRYTSEDPADATRTDSFTRLLNGVFLRCLQKMSVYSYKGNGRRQVETCLVSFHLRKHEVPIADVYSALGWFISYSEDPAGIVSDNAPIFVLYTRLCYNIAEEIRTRTVTVGTTRDHTNCFHPAKTHVFWVGRFPIITAHLSDDERRPSIGDMSTQMSLSASLPRANAQHAPRSNPKNILKDARERMISGITGPLVVDKMKELNTGFVGNCAETLNYASFANQSTASATVGFGFSLTTCHVRGKFTSYHEIIKRAYSPPCESCRELFTHGRVTQQDFASGRILGNLPDDTILPQNWVEKNSTPICKYCHSPITDRMNTTEYCSSNCRNDYIAFRGRTQNRYPPTPHITSWTAQNFPGPSTSIQGYIPATAGYPPSAPQDYTPVTSQWSFHGPPDVHPIPSWKNAHPDRVPGHRDYHPPY